MSHILTLLSMNEEVQNARMPEYRIRYVEESMTTFATSHASHTVATRNRGIVMLINKHAMNNNQISLTTGVTHI